MATTTVSNLSVDLQLNSASFVSGAERARQAMQRSLTGIQSDVSKTRLAIESMTSAVGGFVTGLAATAGAGIGIAAITGLVTKAAREFADGEQAAVKFSSVLKATGNAAGVTADQIGKLADAAEATGTTTAEAFTDAASILATFKSVSGDTFTTAIKLANDLSVVFGQGLSSSATQLGKALEDPVEGLSALRRVGVSFSDAQKDLIAGFVELGDKASAQKVILQELAAQVGGAAEAQGGTLTGTFNAATAAIGNLLERLFTLSGQADATKTALQTIASAADSLFAGGDQTDQQQRLAAFQELQQVEARIADLKAAPGQGLATQLGLAEAEKQAAALRAEVDRLGQSIARVQAAGQNTLRNQAERGSMAALNPGFRGPAPTVEFKPGPDARDYVATDKAAADRRTADAKRTKEALTRLEEERSADFSRLLNEDLEAEKDRDEKRQKDYLATQKAMFDESQRLYKEYQDAANDNQQATADILIRPWEDLASRISSVMAGVFDQILTDAGNLDFGDVAEGIGDTFRTAISGALGNIVTQPLNQAIAKLSTEGLGAVSSNPYLAGSAGIAGGYVASSLGAQALGLNGKYGGVGSAVGGLAGAGLGFAIGGPVGAGVGGFLGSTAGGLLGGLFGGGKMGNDQSRQDYWTSKGKITYSDSSFSSENRQITSGLGGQLAALQEALGGLGATFSNAGIKLGAGNKSGITVNGTRYGSQEEALPAALRLLLNSAGGLSGSQQTAVANTKGRSAQEVLSDVQFAKEFDKITFAGTEFEAAMRDLNEQFDVTARRAHDLGLNEQALAEARAKAVEQLQTAKARQDRDLNVTVLNAIEGDSMQSALRALNNGFAQLVDRMTDAGYSSESLAAAEAARVRQQSELIKQYQGQADAQQQQLDQQVRGVQDYFEGLINPLKSIVANDNRLSPIGQIDQARKAFQETLGLAQGGDVQAIQELSGAAQNLQGLSSRYLGSGGLGADINREVASGAGGIIATLQQQQTETLASLPQVYRETVASQTAALVDEAQKTRESLDQIWRELRNIREMAA